MTDPVKTDYEPMEISPQVSEGGSEGEPMDIECNEGETSTEPPCRSAGNTLKEDTKNLRKGKTAERSKRVSRKRKGDSKLHNNNPEKENEEPPRSSANKGSAGVKNLRKTRKTALERSEKDSPERDKDSKPYLLSTKSHVGVRGDFEVSIKLKRNVKRRS